MTIRKLFFLFWTTLAIGGVTAPVMGLLLQAVYGPIGLDLERELWAGVMFGAMAQMGFFAYMVFNMVAKGFIRNPYLYQGLQLVLTVVILINIAWRQGEEGGSLAGALILPLTVLGFGLITAYWKSRETHPRAFIPTLFFMVAATLLEAIPSLEQKSLEMILLMVLTLLVCNTWQIMQLHRLVKEEPQQTN